MLDYRLGLGKSTKISYKDFLAKFETGETKEAHKWLNSVHKSVFTKLQLLGFDYILCIKNLVAT